MYMWGPFKNPKISVFIVDVLRKERSSWLSFWKRWVWGINSSILSSSVSLRVCMWWDTYINSNERSTPFNMFVWDHFQNRFNLSVDHFIKRLRLREIFIILKLQVVLKKETICLNYNSFTFDLKNNMYSTKQSIYIFIFVKEIWVVFKQALWWCGTLERTISLF